MYRTVTLPTIPEVRCPGRDSFALYDMPGFADAGLTLENKSDSWYGKHSLHEAARMVRTGDLSSVAEADAFMRELDGQVFVSRKFKTVDDVVGAVPNVPAFIAGIPQNMRRRVRTSTATAPLAVYIDLTSSGGIDARDVRRRGVAILALVRLLANFRPVEAWATTGLGGYGGRTLKAAYCGVKLDTAPLDLARVAHVLTSTAVARGIGYGLCNRQDGAKDFGDWPYADVDKQRKHGAAIFRRVAPVGSDVLFIPPVYLIDSSIKTPVAWIKDMLAKYGGLASEAA